MIEEWLIKFVLMCFALMGIIAGALRIIAEAGEDYINDSDQNGENE